MVLVAAAPAAGVVVLLLLLLLLASSAAVVVVVVRAETCAGETSVNQCGLPSACTSGTLVSGLCSGGSDNVCCLQGSVAECDAVGGTCMVGSSCTTSTVGGKCPGSANIRCCLGGSPPPPRCPGESSATYCTSAAAGGSSSSCSGVLVPGLGCDAASGQPDCCLEAPASDSSCRATGGMCYDRFTCERLGGTYATGLCPGSAASVCCSFPAPPPTSQCGGGEAGTCVADGVASCPSGTGTLVPGLCSPATSDCCISGSDANCRAAGGECRTTAGCGPMMGSPVSGLCPGSSDIQCCVPPAPPPPAVPRSAECFPLAQDSLRGIQDNWGGRRSGGSRCHCGMDLLAQAPGLVMAVQDGEVTAVFNFLTCTSGFTANGRPKQTLAIMIYHPALDQTHLYGEVDADTVTVTRGQSVVKGQSLGVAGACGMLHFEIYAGRRTNNDRWFPPSGSVSTDPRGCATHFLSTKPAALVDPRTHVDRLRQSFCLGGASDPSSVTWVPGPNSTLVAQHPPSSSSPAPPSPPTNLPSSSPSPAAGAATTSAAAGSTTPAAAVQLSSLLLLSLLLLLLR